MYLYPWPPEFGLIMAIVAVGALLVFILKRAPKLLLAVFVIIALPFYLLFCDNEETRKRKRRERINKYKQQKNKHIGNL